MKTLKFSCSRPYDFSSSSRGREADISAPREPEGAVNQVRPKRRACGSIPHCMNSFATTCYIATVGDASRAALAPTSKSTTKNSAATPATIQRRV
jgi:hypothetical protein